MLWSYKIWNNKYTILFQSNLCLHSHSIPIVFITMNEIFFFTRKMFRFH
jgi:hypothetical protein